MYLPFGDHTGPSSSTRLVSVSYGFAGSAKYRFVAPDVAFTVWILLTPSRNRFEYCCRTASAIVLLSGPHVGRPVSKSALMFRPVEFSVPHTFRNCPVATSATYISRAPASRSSVSMNAICLPSGDHANCTSGPVNGAVSFCVCPDFRLRIKIAIDPSESVEYAKDFPSGDHVGSALKNLSFVSFFGFCPIVINHT